MSKAEEVASYMKHKLESIAGMPGNRQRAMLAELRRGIGKEPGEVPQIWGLFFENMPEEWMLKEGKISREERAVYLALTLYALHQQGAEPGKTNMHSEGSSVGEAVARLPGDAEEKERILKRFSIILSQSDVNGLVHYLRGMIQALRRENIGFDYVRLAKDLYKYQFSESAGDVRFSWGQDYCRTNNRIQKEAVKNEQ